MLSRSVRNGMRDGLIAWLLKLLRALHDFDFVHHVILLAAKILQREFLRREDCSQGCCVSVGRKSSI